MLQRHSNRNESHRASLFVPATLKRYIEKSTPVRKPLLAMLLLRGPHSLQTIMVALLLTKPGIMPCTTPVLRFQRLATSSGGPWPLPRFAPQPALLATNVPNPRPRRTLCQCPAQDPSSCELSDAKWPTCHTIATRAALFFKWARCACVERSVAHRALDRHVADARDGTAVHPAAAPAAAPAACPRVGTPHTGARVERASPRRPGAEGGTCTSKEQYRCRYGAETRVE